MAEYCGFPVDIVRNARTILTTKVLTSRGLCISTGTAHNQGETAVIQKLSIMIGSALSNEEIIVSLTINRLMVLIASCAKFEKGSRIVNFY